MHLIRVVVSMCQFLLLQLFLLQPTNCLIKYSRPVFQFDQDCGVPKFEGPFMTEKVPQSNLDDAIVAGTVTLRGSLPWIGAIGLKLDFGNVIWFCGSTLISRQWVVTSAHCLAKNWYGFIMACSLHLHDDYHEFCSSGPRRQWIIASWS